MAVERAITDACEPATVILPMLRLGLLTPPKTNCATLDRT